MLVAAAHEPLSYEEGLMQQVGIDPADWYYVDCVIDGCEGVSGEGSWQGVTRWNFSGSGAYGICQALPAEKMARAGEDWQTNILTQLKWCHTYAQERYGGWKAAWEFRKCVGYCTQPKTGVEQYKDHTWW